MRLYVEVARRSFQRHLAYRAATLSGLFTNAVFGVLLASVWSALYAGDDRTRVADFSLQDALTFVWLGQALIMVIHMWGWWEIAATVQTGDVIADLMKPFDYFSYWLSRDLGRAAVHCLTRFAPTLLIGALLYDLVLPVSPGTWIAFAGSIVLAVIVSFEWRFLLNLSAFWLLDVRGLHSLSLVIINVLSGFLIPLTFFPPWLRTIAELLPFRAIVMVPIEVFLGQRAIGSALAIQAFWVVALGLLGRGVMSRAMRKVVIQGG